jgi:predicted nuclease of restriction endonuclease-like (RecB) superfamily
LQAVRAKMNTDENKPLVSSVNSDMETSVSDFAACLARIRGVLAQSRHKALMAVNAAMVEAYWNVGREIVEEEQRGADRAKYGIGLIDELAARLSEEFGGQLSARNLRYMREVYLAFPIWNAVRSKLSWTHYRLLSRVQKQLARDFYMNECIKSRWSTRELERQINSLLFERLALSRDKDAVVKLSAEGHEPFTALDLIKDPYVLEFTGLPERGSFQETDLEQAIMDRLQSFLLELGRGFFFVARQKRLTIDGDHFYIDLVFYHRTLRCFVLIDLKTGKLTQQDIGQMLLYTGYYEKEEMAEGENPPIGLILCTNKNDAAVRYTLSQTTQKIFAARYQLYLPTEEELRAELIRERHAIEMEDL